MQSLLVLLLLASVLTSVVGGSVVSFTCSSELTPIGTGACVGVPVKCALTLNATLCDNDGAVVQLSNSEVMIQVTQITLYTPEFVVDQTNATVEVVMDYVPSLDSSTINVEVTSTNPNCRFVVASGPVIVTDADSCNYPLSFTLSYSSPSSAVPVSGGDIISLTLEVNVNNPSVVEDLTITHSLLHPALRFVSENTTNSNPLTTITSPITSHSNDPHSLLQSTSFIPLVLISSLAHNESLSTNLYFQVQPYVLPQSILYMSVHLFYHYSSFSTYSITQSIDQLREYIVSEVSVGNITIDLPYYNPRDYQPNTFPSQEVDIFTVTVPVVLPCVSTDITVNILLPEFWSDLFTRYFVNITSTNLTAPLNLMSIPQLCDYTDLNASMCDFDELTGVSPVAIASLEYEEQWAAGRDNITISTGPLMYNITTGQDCSLMNTSDSCRCTETQLEIFLTVLVLTDVYCENQTISDNITTTVTHTTEVTTWAISDTTHTNPTIAQSVDPSSFLYAVNASTPAISLPISTHSGDAGDHFLVTFGVQHDSEYSKFTAYDLNYTFSIDTRLDPNETIQICFYDSASDPVSCENVPFVNYTIVRDGYHEIFTLHTHRVELSLNVTIVQEVAPGISFCNPGDTIFEALPDNYTLSIAPLVCTNSSCGNVNIDQVVLNRWIVHWSNVPPTVTEDSEEEEPNPHHVTIGEQFNTTIKACMPECLTGVNLCIDIPTHNDGEPKLRVDDAYVTFVGSELYNTTLFEGDTLTTSENITINNDGSLVTFFFGPEVLVPKDNILIGDEQCFEIGLLCTVSNTPVFNGDQFHYRAVVETDFGIRTQIQTNRLQIVEPDLITRPANIPGVHDAGDMVTSVIDVEHSTSNAPTSAYRLNMTVTYPKEYLSVNESDIDSAMLLLNGMTQLYPAFIDSGTVIFSIEKLGATDTLQSIIVFTLEQNIVNSQIYTVKHLLEWHNLPYELPAEGRHYNTTGIQSIQIASSQLTLSYTTSNEDTPANNVQLQEYVYLNLTIIPPEGVSPLTVKLSHIGIMGDDYPFNITNGKLQRVGSQLSNISLTPSDNLTTSSAIALTGISTITFNLGGSVVHTSDNLVTKEDEIELFVEGYISNNGDGFINQDIILRAGIIQEPLIIDDAMLRLVHPQLQVQYTTTPSGPWDAGDLVNLTVFVEHVMSNSYAAYELLMRVQLDGGHSVNNLTMLHSSRISGPPSCTEAMHMRIGTTEVIVSELLFGCVAKLYFLITLPEREVVIGDNITIEFTLIEYYAVSLTEATLSRVNIASSITFQKSEPSKTPFQVFESNVSNPLNYVAPFHNIEVTLTVTLPEGTTRDMSISFNTIFRPPGDPATNLSLVLQSTDIHPIASQMAPPFLGDVINVADNILSIDDTIILVLTLITPNNPGTPFSIFAITTYNTSSGVKQVVAELDFAIVQPMISVTTDALSERLSRIAYTEVIHFDILIERVDSMFPNYDIFMNVSLEFPPTTLLNLALDGLSVRMTDNTGSGTSVSLDRSVLSYIDRTSTQFFHFEGNFIPNVTNGLVIQGSVMYIADPYTFMDYFEEFSFPNICFVQPKLVAESLIFHSLSRNGGSVEVVTWELILADIFGPPYDLIVDIQIETSVLNLFFVEIQSFGQGLNFTPPVVVMNTTLQAQLVFHNLTLFLNDSLKICSDCATNIIILVHTQLVNEVGRHTKLVNATAYYVSEEAEIESKNTLIDTSFNTANTDTSGNLIQVGEVVALNITITLPENHTTSLTLNFAITQTFPLDYPMIVSAVRVLHIGASIKNTVLAVGDSQSSPHIIVSNNALRVIVGTVFNSGDGVTPEESQVVIGVIVYAHKQGSGLANQTISLHSFVEEEPFVRDTITFQLIHPQLKMNLVAFSPRGPWDGKDLITFVLDLNHLATFPQASAYDLQFTITTNQGVITSTTIQSLNIMGPSCLTETLFCTVLSQSSLTCGSLPSGCTASISLSVQLPLMTVSGTSIILVTALQYDSNPVSSPHTGVIYNPLLVNFTEQLDVPVETLTLSTNYPFVNETLLLTMEIILPEGITLNLSTVINASDTNQTITPSISLYNISVGGNINASSTKLINQFPELGDLFVSPDNNNSLPELDTITITYSVKIPEEAELATFHVVALTSYSTEENETIIINSTDIWVVIPEPLLSINIAVSERLVDVGYLIVYNISMIYTPRLELSDLVVLINTSISLPSFVHILPNDIIGDTSQLENIDSMKVMLPYMERNSSFAVIFSLLVLVNVSNETAILATTEVEYAFSGFQQRVFSFLENYSDVYLTNLNTVFSLMSTSFPFTHGNIITFGETAVWHLLISDIVGPPQNLTIGISHSFEHLEIVAVNLLYIGSNLTSFGVPNITALNQTVLLVFQDLTITNPESYTGTQASCNCDIHVEVSYTPLRREIQNQVTQIDVDLVYGSIQKMEKGELLITPPSKLSINLIITSNDVQGGSNLPAFAMIQHNSTGPFDAYNLVARLPNQDPQVNISENATAQFSNGTTITFNSDILLESGGGLNVPVLPWNETIVISLVYSFLPLITLGRILTFNASVKYSNTNTSSPGYQDIADDTEEVKLTSLNEIHSLLTSSSCPYTNGNNLTINEIFELTISKRIRHGVSTPEFHAVFTTVDGTPLPLNLLSVNSSIPNATTFTTSENATFDIVPYSPSELLIVWTWGVISNKPDGHVDDSDLIEVKYTFGISENATLTRIQVESHVFNLGSNETEIAEGIKLKLIEPDLTTTLDIEVLEEGNPRIVRLTYRVFHSEASTAPAFFVEITNIISLNLSLVSPVDVIYDDGGILHEESQDEPDAVINLSNALLFLGSSITFSYLVQMDFDSPERFNISNIVEIGYTTIEQEGIGLLYPEYDGRRENETSTVCLTKVFVRVPVEIIDYLWLLVWMIVGICIGIFICVLVILIYYCYIYIQKYRLKRRIIPALLLGMFSDDQEDECLIFRAECRRPLFSSLLTALPREEWFDTNDTYAGTETDYIAEVERELFFIEQKAVSRLLVHLLETKTNLKLAQIHKAKTTFDFKVNELRIRLKESMKIEIQKQAYQSVGDKITCEEDLSNSQTESIGELQSCLTVDVDTTVELLEQLEEEHELEREELFSTIGLEKKRAELIIAHCYMTHFILGAKALIIQTIQEFYSGENVAMAILELSSELDEHIFSEAKAQEEASIIRGKRQQHCLLEKKLVEMEDLHCEEQMLRLIESGIARMKRARVTEDPSILLSQLKDSLLSEMERLRANKKEAEIKIDDKGISELERREKELAIFIFSETIGLSSVKHEIERWHSLQNERELVLKEVEEKAILELNNYWEIHTKQRNQLIEEQTTKLSQLLLSKGVQLQTCDEILRQHSKRRLKAKEKLDTSILIQRAKFQARVEQQKQRVSEAAEMNTQLHYLRNQVEKHFLLDVTSGVNSEEQVEQIEQYHKDMAILSRSVALERLKIYLKAKVRVSAYKNRKLQSAQNKCRQLLQNGKTSDQIEEVFSSYLRQRQRIGIESFTKVFQEERKKAEEDHMREREREVQSITTRSIDMVLAGEEASQTNRMLYQIEESATKKISSSEATLQVDLVNIQADTKKLMTDHRENLIKVNSKLEAEKQNIAQSFQKKLERRRLQRVNAIMDIAVPGTSAEQIAKPSKFVVAVRKVMLSERLKVIREQHKKELDTAMEDIQRSYEQQRHEAFSKLERKFENHLLKLGKHSHEELIKIFHSIDTWQDQLKKPTRGRARSYSIVAGASHSTLLPPISAMRRLTCPDLY